MRSRWGSIAAVVLVVGALLASGCKTPARAPRGPIQLEPQVLQVGDGIKIEFASATNLNTQQNIRRDGKITLGVIGEVVAAGKTPAQLEKDLVDLYANQLVSREIKVIVVSSSYAVYVGGAVLKPGKVMAERVLTPLEAIMEAGGYDTAKANLKAVKVIRQENGETKNFQVNVKAILDAKDVEPFFLKSHDTVIVPEKFEWF